MSYKKPKRVDPWNQKFTEKEEIQSEGEETTNAWSLLLMITSLILASLLLTFWIAEN